MADGIRYKKKEGIVDKSENHFRLKCGDINKVEPKDFIPIAFVDKGKDTIFVVEFTTPEDFLSNKKA